MILLDSLYKVQSRQLSETGGEFTIALDPEHFIYKAHFPGEPITPGVCIMQIAKELMEICKDCKLNITTVKNIKFLRIITPTATPVVDWAVSRLADEEGLVKAQITASVQGEPYAKLSLICQKA